KCLSVFSCHDLSEIFSSSFKLVCHLIQNTAAEQAVFFPRRFPKRAQRGVNRRLCFGNASGSVLPDDLAGGRIDAVAVLAGVDPAATYPMCRELLYVCHGYPLLVRG